MSMDRAEPTDRVDLRDYLRVLRRRWLLITATTVLITSAALGKALVETPLYRANATVTIETSSLSATGGGNQITDQEIDTQLQVLQSEEVAARAAEALGIGLGPRALLAKSGVQRVPGTRVLEVLAIDADPQRAADIAQAFAEAYLVDRRDDALTRVLEATTALQGRTEGVRNRIDDLDREIAGTPDDQAAELVQERQALQDQLSQLNAQLTLLEATESFVRGGGEIIRAATPPRAPVSPQPVRSGMLGLLAGLSVGLVLAFARDRFDDAIRTDADVSHALHGRAVLGHVPVFEPPDDGQALELLARPDSVASEALRTLRTNVRFAVGRQTLRTLLVTSPGEGEGKSTVAANMAIAAARAGQRVLLVDADLRRPNIHRLFGIANGVGATSVLAGDESLRAIVQDVGVPGLVVATAGQRPPNPAELLADGMEHVVREAIERVDMVVVDGPPVLAVADSLEISRTVEATLLVVAHGLTGRRATAEAGHRLSHVGGNLVGAVMNVAPPELDYYGYYYGPAIEQDAQGRVRRGWRSA